MLRQKCSIFAGGASKRGSIASRKRNLCGSVRKSTQFSQGVRARQGPLPQHLDMFSRKPPIFAGGASSSESARNRDVSGLRVTRYIATLRRTLPRHANCGPSATATVRHRLELIPVSYHPTRQFLRMGDSWSAKCRKRLITANFPPTRQLWPSRHSDRAP